MVGMKFCLFVILAVVFVQVYGQNDDQNCPPEWSLVHQCWKIFENRYKQFRNDTAVTVREQEVQEMCSCMEKAVSQAIANAVV